MLANIVLEYSTKYDLDNMKEDLLKLSYKISADGVFNVIKIGNIDLRVILKPAWEYGLCYEPHQLKRLNELNLEK